MTFYERIKEIFDGLRKLHNNQKIKNIGYDGDLGCFMPSYTPSSFVTYNVLKLGLKEIFNNMTDICSDIHKLRAIKTDYEIKKIKKANLVAKESAKAFYHYAQEGIREIDVAAEILRAVQQQAGKNGIKFTYCDPPQITSGPERTFTANALTCPATGKRLKKDELVVLELGGCADGYWFDLTRTLVVGGAPLPVHLDMADAIKDASKSVYSAYSDGCNISGELTQIGLNALKKAGFKKGIVHGLGHGVGFSYHEVLPGIGPGSPDIIESNMVTSMEPGLYLPDIGGIRIEENILWKKNKVSILSSYHNGLDKWNE